MKRTVWLLGRSPILGTVERALLQSGQAVHRGDEPPSEPAIVVVDCTRSRRDPAHLVREAIRSAPEATCLALVANSTHEAIAGAFSAGAHDFVPLDKDPLRALEAITLHVHLTMRRQGLRRTSDVVVPPLPDPVIAEPSAEGPDDEAAYGLSCVVSPGGRILRSSASMAPYLDERPGASFFELIHPEERPAMRNAALLLLAGEPAVQTHGRIGEAATPVLWRLVLHPAEERILALGTPQG